MSAEVVIVGAVTYDEIHSPAGDVDELLGGSAVHAGAGGSVRGSGGAGIGGWG